MLSVSSDSASLVSPSPSPSNSPLLFVAVSDFTGAVPIELSPANRSDPQSYMVKMIKVSQ